MIIAWIVASSPWVALVSLIIFKKRIKRALGEEVKK